MIFLRDWRMLMNKIKKYTSLAVVMIVIMTQLLAFNQKVNAAPAVGTSVSSASGNVGDVVSVTVNIYADFKLGASRMYLSYDADMLEYVSGADAGGAGSVNWLDTGDNPVSKTINFKIIASGSSSVSVIGSSYVVGLDEYSDEKIQVTGSSGTVSGKTGGNSGNDDNGGNSGSDDNGGNSGSDDNGGNQGEDDNNGGESYSSDNYLSSLEISPGSLSPAFSVGRTSYSVSVADDVTKLIVSADTRDGNANVRISDTSLSVGQNTIYITVTAENGDERTYTLNVTRGGTQESSSDSENSSNQQNEPQYTKVTMNGTDFVISDDFGAYPLPDGFEETEIDYNGTKVKAAKGYAGKVTIMYLDAVLSPEKSGYYIYDSVTKTFSKYIQIAQPSISYVILNITSSMEIPAGYKLSEEQINGMDVIVLKGSSDQYCLFYGVSSDGVTGWYCYDYKYQTIQRFFALPDSVKTVAGVSENVSGGTFSSGTFIWKIISAVCAVAAVAAVICAGVFASKSSKNKKIARELVGNQFDEDEFDDENELEDDEDDEDMPDSDNDSIVIDDDTVETLDITEVMDSDDDK